MASFAARAAFFAAIFAFLASTFWAYSSGVSLASLDKAKTLSLSCAPFDTHSFSFSRSILSLSSWPFAVGLKKPNRSIKAPSLGRLSSATVIK